MFLVLWWGDMTNVQVVKLFFIRRQRGITVATSPNRSASSSRMMIMKTNGSLAWRWNHMRITVRHKHACVCIHTHRPKYTNLLGMRQNKPLLCGRRVGDSSAICVSLYPHTLVCVIVCSWTTETEWICGAGVWGVVTCIFCVLCVATTTCRLISLQPFEASTKTAMCPIAHFQRRSGRHHEATVFPVVPSSAYDFEERPVCTLAFIHLPIQ